MRRRLDGASEAIAKTIALPALELVPGDGYNDVSAAGWKNNASEKNPWKKVAASTEHFQGHLQVRIANRAIDKTQQRVLPNANDVRRSMPI